MTQAQETPTPQAQENAPEVTASQEELIKQAKAEGFAEAQAYMTEVQDLCVLAGAPEKAEAFIKKTVPVAEVRKALLESKSSPAINGIMSRRAWALRRFPFPTCRA